MKPRNFPARKLKRQIDADLRNHKLVTPYSEEILLLEQARKIRTKKHRG